MLDHVLLGCSDLDQGIAFVEQRTGVRAAAGGVHPGRGTRNALLSLGERRYLEIIAPDPEQKNVEPFAVELLNRLKALKAPMVVEWAAHVDDIAAMARMLDIAGVEFEGPTPGSRKRPDGRVLTWRTLSLAMDYHSLMPFFIQWGKDVVHPSVDAPKGCRLEKFVVATPQPDDLAKDFKMLGIDVSLERAEKASLRATIVGPKGTVEAG